jgi:hypothetical protein
MHKNIIKFFIEKEISSRLYLLISPHSIVKWQDVRIREYLQILTKHNKWKTRKSWKWKKKKHWLKKNWN